MLANATFAASPTALPIPCVPGACGATGASQFVTSGTASAVASKNTLTVNQTTNSAILNWSSFDIGANAAVVFHQPTTASIALNRIFQGSPTQILGKLSANGQVYLINLNGFIFGSTSTVNVGSLTVSSLPLSLTDANFASGILSPLQNDKPAFDATLDPLAPGVGRLSVLDANGNPVLDASGKPLAVQVVVQPGAQITAGSQGRVLLAGQSVTNGGTLLAPDGQVVLAAGSQIFLQADSDPALRGLVVEVDGTAANSAVNQVSGLLSAPRGNVTMVGLAVNQEGRVSATTSVSANGSIRLEAAGGAVISGTLGDQLVASSQGGALTIGPQSQMQITADASGGTAVADQTQYASSVTLLGEQVIMQGGSIVAPGGTLTAIAAMNPAQAAVVPTATAAAAPYTMTGVTSTPDPNARLRIDSGASIDLSGSSASLPVTANLVSGQLRSSELADDPTQRDGALHGLTVYIDARNGSPPIANLSGEIAGLPQTIAQRTEAGGHAILQSEGDIVFAPGASLNVSGGASTYAGGVLQTSYLVGANGQLYPIATANPLLTYTGVVNPTFTQTFNAWGVQDVLPSPGLSTYQPGYVQGAAAGSVQFAASTLVLQGSLLGNVTNGLYQRTPSTAVSGGQLIIGVPGGVAGNVAALDYLTPGVRVTANPTPVVVADDASLPGSFTLDLPVSYLTGSGFTAINIYSNADVTLPASTPLVLPPGSTLSVDAARVDILSSITDSGGKLAFENVTNLGSIGTPAQRSGVFVGDDVTLDVRGLFTDDALSAGITPTAQTWQNGGSIDLSVASAGALLAVGNDVTLHASGGAWIGSKGSVVAGTGGSVALNSNAAGGGLDVGGNLAVDGFGVNGAAGGSFSLSAPRIDIATGNGGITVAQNVDDALSTGAVFSLNSSLFSNYGFEQFNLTAVGVPPVGTTAVMTVNPGTAIDATVSTLLLSSQAGLMPSATTVSGVSTTSMLAAYLRPGATINLAALPQSAPATTALDQPTAGDIVIGSGASILTDAGGSIKLTSQDSILVNGTLRAPSGSVALHLTSPSTDVFDPGFLPEQRIELGSTAVIDVAGTFLSQPAAAGLSLGQVLPGGAVSLLADRGTVITDAGSLISMGGVTAGINVPQANGSYGYELAASAGGSLIVHSGESISLLGAIAAAAGVGGTSGTAAAGSLEVDLTRAESWWGVNTTAASNTYNQAPLIVEIGPTVPSTVPASLANSNQALLGAVQLGQSGVDALSVEAGNAVEFTGNFSLSLGRQLLLNAPVIAANVGAQAALSAPYVQLGYTLAAGQTPQNSNLAQSGSGTLSFSGAQIDLLGSTVFQGTSAVQLMSTGDLLLRGNPVGSNGAITQVGSLTVEGDLTLDAARIYPATATSFSIDAIEDPSTGRPGTVTIGQSGVNPGTPLSAGGALSISAYSVASTGTLYAPFGSIAIDATHAITLGDGSLTSVSGNGVVIPYGATEFGGEQWTYNFAGQLGNEPEIISAIPTRAVALTAPNIALSKQATIDLSGGGDLYAYEWVPGPGGSRDALAPSTAVAAAATPGLYAVLPSTLGQSAPSDPQLADAGIAPGESVYLSGGAGLAAGFYPLLPARYGLTPGAFLVQIEPTLQSTSAGSLGSLADGTPVVAGYLSYGSTGLHQTPGYIGIAVHPGGDTPKLSYAQQLASYDVNLASTFFSAAAAAAGESRPVLPADAGSLSLAVSNSLDVAGLVRTAAATGGLAAPIQISATDLVVGTATGPVPADAISISAAVLSAWQPGSLLLGGLLTPETGTSTAGAGTAAIDVTANTVTIGAGSSLTAGQIILVANQSIDVQSGATLQSTSGAAGTTLKSAPAVQTVFLSGTSADPGLLAVSDLNWLIPQRTSGAVAAGAGTVAVDAGATIASGGALTFDGIGGLAINGTVTGPGAEWSLGAANIAITPAAAGAAALTAAGVDVNALTIDPALITALAGAGAVRLASTGALDLLTSVSLGVTAGVPSLGALTLEASSIDNLSGPAGAAGAIAAQFGAHTLTLQGSGASAATLSAGPAGSTLTFSAGELDLGPNALGISGFATTNAAVSGAVIGRGTGALNVDGDLTLTTAGITAASGASTAISATGAFTVNAVTGTVPELLGGALTLSGNSLAVAGRILAPGGNIALSAVDGVDIESGAILSTAGTVVDIGNQSYAAPGGNLAITAGGTLVLGVGASLDVSGAGAADAGSLRLTAGGAATLDGSVKGVAAVGANGGSFSLDALSLPTVGGETNDLTPLAADLSAGGFTDAIALRLRSGGLSLDAGSSLTANSVILTADSGAVVIGSPTGVGSTVVSAPSGNLRGRIAIFGGGGVTLEAGAVLEADGVGATGLGGSVEIGAGQLVADQGGNITGYKGGSILLNGGSTIAAAGAAGNGVLLLRAPAIIAADPTLNGVAIAVGPGASLAQITSVGATSQLSQVIIEPVLAFNTNSAAFSSATAPTAADFQNLGQQSIAPFMATAAPNIAAALAPHGGLPLVVQAGIEVIAPGDLTLPALDLSTAGLGWQYNGQPVDLTVRAAGNLTLSGTVSDGFANVQVGHTMQPTLLAGPSASLRLVAGSDLSAADPLAVTAGPSNLTLGSGNGAVLVRTGTGDIDLVAANDIQVGSGSGAYTAGTPAIAPGGTAADPYPNVATPLDTPLLVNGSVVGLQIPNTSILMSQPSGGGNLRVQAGGDIVNEAPSPLGVTAWQPRESGTGYSAAGTPAWGVNLATYNWNFGTLGGGDLSIAAGGSAQNVSAAAADSLLPQSAGATPAYVRSGGLALTAGGDIGSAQVYLADGAGAVRSGGGLTAILPTASGENAGAAFYLQSSSIEVASRLGAVVDGVYNPTALIQPSAGTVIKPLVGQFYSYGDNSSFNIEAVTGDIVFGSSDTAAQTLLGKSLSANLSSLALGAFPANLYARSLTGDIDFGPGIGIGGGITLYPSAQGQLDLLAGSSINGGQITLSDAVPGSFASVLSPHGLTPLQSQTFVGDIHGTDTAPALVTAGDDIEQLALSIPKAATVVAGEDIIDLTYQGQNQAAADITLFSAGRDFVYTNDYTGTAMSLGGPGQLDILAGRNITLGFSNGVVTTGNLSNANLAITQGAEINLVTGLGTAPDVVGDASVPGDTGFLGKIIAPSTSYQSELVSYVETLQASTGLTYAQAATVFASLPLAQQLPLLDSVFFSELSLSGLAETTVAKAGFTEGYAAINALYPGSGTGSTPVAGAFAGNLTLDYSQIYTLSGGDINLVTPGGDINVGLAAPPATQSSKSPSQLGIVTEGPGNINIYSQGDVNVNSSRIFTLGGGNILIWSNEGSIDAGLGAKTSISAPPPSILISSTGAVTEDFSGAATGSGIRTIQTEPTTPPGDVDLIAPVGTVDAGDAGIGAAGNINIAARSVVGATNINFGGTATGVPATVSNVSASLSGASSAAAGSTNASTSAAESNAAAKEGAAPLAQTALTWLDVFVTGLGEENCKPDDIDCLKRQRTPTR